MDNKLDSVSLEVLHDRIPLLDRRVKEYHDYYDDLMVVIKAGSLSREVVAMRAGLKETDDGFYDPCIVLITEDGKEGYDVGKTVERKLKQSLWRGARLVEDITWQEESVLAAIKRYISHGLKMRYVVSFLPPNDDVGRENLEITVYGIPEGIDLLEYAEAVLAEDRSLLDSMLFGRDAYPPSDKKCAGCGVFLREGAQYCHQCGKTV